MSLEISIYLNHMHGSNTCFVWKIDLRMFMIKIESYGDIIFYFVQLEICMKYLTLFYTAL